MTYDTQHSTGNSLLNFCEKRIIFSNLDKKSVITDEQVDQFKYQISAGIDRRVKELELVEEEAAQNLFDLKKSIITSITKDRANSSNPLEKEKKEKFTGDLQLTTDELEIVSDEVAKQNKNIFTGDKSSNFYQFRQLLGLTNLDKSIDFEYDLKSVKILNTTPKIFLPLGLDKTAIRNYKKIFALLNERTDLKEFFTNDVELISNGGARIDFILTNGKKYTASPEGVFQVEKEPTQEEKQRFIHLELEMYKNKESLWEQIKKDKSLDRYERRILMSGRPQNLSEKLKIPEKYRILVAKISNLEQQHSSLDKSVRYRKILTKSGERITEEIDPKYKGVFSYTFKDKNGKLLKKISYGGNTKTEVSEYREGFEKSLTGFYPNGNIDFIQQFQKQEDNSSKIISSVIFKPNGIKESISTENQEFFFYKNGEKIDYKRIKKADNTFSTRIIGDNGLEIGTLSEMKSLSHDEYIDLLAKNLTTGERIAKFLELFMEYTDDSPDPNNPLKKGTKQNRGDYWQLAEETVRRVENGKMLGDCDDYAFLAKAILRKQGKNAFVEHIPKHAICIWFEKNEFGKWDGFSLGTFGYDKNGRENKNPQGYNTLKEAHFALMKKYESHGLGLKNGLSPSQLKDLYGDKITILNIPKKGKRELIKDIPLVLTTKKEVLDSVIVLEKEENNFIKLNKYEKLLKEYPQLKDFLGTQIIELVIKIAKETDNDNFLISYVEKHKNIQGGNLILGNYFANKYTEASNKKALAYYNKAIKNNTTEAEAYEFVANNYKNKENFTAEIQILNLLFQRVEKKNINNDAYLNLGEAYVKNKEIDKAIALYESNIGNDSRINSRLSYLYYFHKQDEIQAKKTYFIRNKDSKPLLPNTYDYENNNVQFYSALLSIFFDNKKIDHRGINKEFLDKNPIIKKIFTQKRNALQKLFSYKEMKMYAYKEMEMNAYKDLSDIYVKEGDFKNALISINKAIEKNKSKYTAISLISDKALILYSSNIYKFKKLFDSSSKEIKREILYSTAYILTLKMNIADKKKFKSHIEKMKIIHSPNLYLYTIEQLRVHKKDKEADMIVKMWKEEFPNDKNIQLYEKEILVRNMLNNNEMDKLIKFLQEQKNDQLNRLIREFCRAQFRKFFRDQYKKDKSTLGVYEKIVVSVKNAELYFDYIQMLVNNNLKTKARAVLDWCVVEFPNADYSYLVNLLKK